MPNRATSSIRVALLLCAAALPILAACGDRDIVRPGPGADGFIELSAVTHAGGRFVAVGGTQAVEDGYLVVGSDRAAIAISDDGESWRRAPLPELEGALFEVAHGNGAFVAVGGRAGGPTGPRSLMLRSEDGESWAEVEGAPGLSWRSIVFGNGRFLAAGIDPATLWYDLAASIDGIDWEVIATTNLFSTRLAFGDGRFLLYGEAGGVGVSEDGENWEWIALPPLNLVTSIAHLDGRWVSSGVFDCCFGEVPAAIEYYASISADGRQWETTRRPAGPTFHVMAFGNGAYLGLAVGEVLRSTDLASWSRTFDAEEGMRWRTGATFAQGKFVVVGRHEITTSADGQSWRATAIPE
jgi:hypothetical protein